MSYLVSAPRRLILVALLAVACVSPLRAEEPEQEEQLTSATLASGEKLSLEEYPRVKVNAPFVNIHSGAGRGYPVFYIAEQDEVIWVVRRKVDWFNIVTSEGKTGWISLDSMLQTRNLDGSPIDLTTFSEQDYYERTWELGFRTGDFEGANVLAINGAWQFTDNLSLEFVYGQGIGDFSEVRQTTAMVVNSPWPRWMVSPYFGVGAGIVKVTPNAALVQETDREDEVVFAAGGVKTYITDRFLLRAEYRQYVILTTQELNEEIEEWTIGFSVFF